MIPPRVLVLDNHSFNRSVNVMLLRRLGVRDILQASDGEQALKQLRLSGGADVVLCDLADKSSECLEFLLQAERAALVRAVAFCNVLRPDLHRALGQASLLAGLELLGVMRQPMQLRSLHRLLHRYKSRGVAPATSVMRELPSETEVRRGLARGEFRAWFQPKLLMERNSLVGLETLVRWEHPTKGVLLPKEFLAAVLAYDLIDEMFMQTLEQGASLLGVLRREGVNLELAFNLHASQISAELVERIRSALKSHALPGSALSFELSENGLLHLPSETHDNLLRLRLLGCGLAIDDFGAGFSSMQLACLLPFNQIKLDQKFAQSLDRPSSKAMVASTIALARSLNLNLVIEGVSNQWVRNTLISMGGGVGQGFHLARPMSLDGLLKWLSGRKLGHLQGKSQEASYN